MLPEIGGAHSSWQLVGASVIDWHRMAQVHSVYSCILSSKNLLVQAKV
jgi:hypothetical protein